MRFALPVLLLLAACEVKVTTPTNVDVSCETTAEGVDCVVKHNAGSTETEVCWDVILTCANGEIVKAPHMCTKVAVGGTAKATRAKDKLENIDKCHGDKPPTLKAENLTFDGKAPDIVTPHKN